MFVKIIVSLVVGWILWSWLALFQNYRKVPKSDIRVLINPIDSTNPLWFVTSSFLHPLLKRLPFGLGEFADRLLLEYTYLDEYRDHQKYGAAFFEVSPARTKLWVADPQAFDDMFKRRNDFIKPSKDYFALEIFGPNLDTVNGKVWDRHKRITTPPFNEKNNALVWKTTNIQATAMFNLWLSSGSTVNTQKDVRKMALNVLCSAGFGVDANFIEDRSDLKNIANASEQRYGYRECLGTILDSFFVLIFHYILEKVHYPYSLMWGQLKHLTSMKDEFRRYMNEIIASERTLYEQGNADRHNLISAMVRADVEAKKNDATDNIMSMRGLSTEELYGNLFIYNFAGHDTTAMTLHFSILCLAMRPDIQDWIAEEVAEIVRDTSSSGEQFYEIAFPRAHRCLALMYETLRLYGPVIVMSRATVNETHTPLVIGDKSYSLPEDLYILANVAGCQRIPALWENDPLEFRPARFVTPASGTGGECFRPPPVAGSFLAWSHGPRTCPGRKFSQVEFVAALFVFFAQNHRVSFVRKTGETQAEVVKKAMKLINEAKVGPTLRINGDMELKWEFKA